MNYDMIVDLVKEAGKFVFDETLRTSVSIKGESDYVTAVDLKISSFLKLKLKEMAPEVGFMSEEDYDVLEEKRWILDPIDGTTNLVYNYNFSSVSLAYYEENRVMFGVIYNPYNNDLFVATRGDGAYLNGKRLSFAKDRTLNECIVEFGAGSTQKQYADESFAIGKEVFKNCLDLRRNCSSALAIAYVAAGKMNGYFERNIKPWDYAAATLLLDECGVLYSDWEGKDIQYETQTSFVCGTPKVYKLICDKINNFKSV